MRILILGGTAEALELADALKHDARFAPTLSLAGVTRAPRLPSIPSRIGGFGGAEGLARYLEEHDVHWLVLATHPFASQIRMNAIEAARTVQCPLLIIERPQWTALPEDRWTHVSDMKSAAAALGTRARRVLLTIGRKELPAFAAHPQHFYVIRTIDAPSLNTLPPHAEIITARGPFTEAEERNILLTRRIDVLVTKNSGGSATEAKLTAARACGVPVVIVDRPPMPSLANVRARIVSTIPDAVKTLTERH